MTSTEELERLLAEATPGPWFTFANGHCVGGTPTDGSAGGVAMCSMAARTPQEVQANSALIVAAVNALPELVERVKRLEEALQTIRDRYIPDQPAAYDVSEADYTRKHYMELRMIARAALKETKP